MLEEEYASNLSKLCREKDAMEQSFEQLDQKKSEEITEIRKEMEDFLGIQEQQYRDQNERVVALGLGHMMTLQGELSCAQTLISDLEAKVAEELVLRAELESTIDSLTDDVNSLKENEEKRTEFMIADKNELQSLRELHQNDVSSLHERLQTIVRDHKNVIDNETQRTRMLENEICIMKDNSDKSLAMRAAEIEALQVELAREKSQVETLLAATAEKESELNFARSSFQKDTDNMEARLRGANTLIRSLQDDQQEVQQKFALHFEAFRTEINQLKESNEKLDNDLSHERTRVMVLENTVMSRSKRLEAMKTRLNAVSEELQHTRSEKETITQTCSTLQESLSVSEKKLNDLEMDFLQRFLSASAENEENLRKIHELEAEVALLTKRDGIAVVAKIQEQENIIRHLEESSRSLQYGLQVQADLATGAFDEISVLDSPTSSLVDIKTPTQASPGKTHYPDGTGLDSSLQTGDFLTSPLSSTHLGTYRTPPTPNPSRSLVAAYNTSENDSFIRPSRTLTSAAVDTVAPGTIKNSGGSTVTKPKKGVTFSPLVQVETFQVPNFCEDLSEDFRTESDVSNYSPEFETVESDIDEEVSIHGDTSGGAHIGNEAGHANSVNDSSFFFPNTSKPEEVKDIDAVNAVEMKKLKDYVTALEYQVNSLQELSFVAHETKNSLEMRVQQLQRENSELSRKALVQFQVHVETEGAVAVVDAADAAQNRYDFVDECRLLDEPSSGSGLTEIGGLMSPIEGNVDYDADGKLSKSYHFFMEGASAVKADFTTDFDNERKAKSDQQHDGLVAVSPASEIEASRLRTEALELHQKLELLSRENSDLCDENSNLKDICCALEKRSVALEKEITVLQNTSSIFLPPTLPDVEYTPLKEIAEKIRPEGEALTTELNDSSFFYPNNIQAEVDSVSPESKDLKKLKDYVIALEYQVNSLQELSFSATRDKYSAEKKLEKLRIQNEKLLYSQEKYHYVEKVENTVVVIDSSGAMEIVQPAIAPEAVSMQSLSLHNELLAVEYGVSGLQGGGRLADRQIRSTGGLGRKVEQLKSTNTSILSDVGAVDNSLYTSAVGDESALIAVQDSVFVHDDEIGTGKYSSLRAGYSGLQEENRKLQDRLRDLESEYSLVSVEKDSMNELIKALESRLEVSYLSGSREILFADEPSSGTILVAAPVQQKISSVFPDSANDSSNFLDELNMSKVLNDESRVFKIEDPSTVLLQKENERLSSLLEALEYQATSAQEFACNLQTINFELEAKLKTAKASINHISAILVDKEGEIEALRSSDSARAHQSQQWSSKTTDGARQSVSPQLEDKSQKIQNASTGKSLMPNEASLEKQDVLKDNKHSVIADLQAQVLEERQRSTALSNENGRLVKSLEGKVAQLDSLKEEGGHEAMKVEALKAEALNITTDLKIDASESRKHIAELQSALDATKAAHEEQLLHLNSEAGAMQDKITLLKSKGLEKCEQVRALKEVLRGKESEFQSSIEALESRNADLAAQVEDYQREIESLQEAVKAKEQLQEDRSSHSLSVENLNNELYDKNMRILELQEMLASAQRDYQAFIADQSQSREIDNTPRRSALNDLYEEDSRLAGYRSGYSSGGTVNQQNGGASGSTQSADANVANLGHKSSRASNFDPIPNRNSVAVEPDTSSLSDLRLSLVQHQHKEKELTELVEALEYQVKKLQEASFQANDSKNRSDAAVEKLEKANQTLQSNLDHALDIISVMQSEYNQKYREIAGRSPPTRERSASSLLVPSADDSPLIASFGMSKETALKLIEQRESLENELLHAREMIKSLITHQADLEEKLQVAEEEIQELQKGLTTDGASSSSSSSSSGGGDGGSSSTGAANGDARKTPKRDDSQPPRTPPIHTTSDKQALKDSIMKLREQTQMMDGSAGPIHKTDSSGVSQVALQTQYESAIMDLKREMERAAQLEIRNDTFAGLISGYRGIS